MSSTAMARNKRSGRGIALGTLRILIALTFLMAGIAKLAGLTMMVTVFEHVGFGQWFRYVTGAIEIGSALLLLTHRFVGIGGLLLVATMVCAIFAHLTVVPGSPLPALLLLVLSAIIVWAFRTRTLDLFSSSSNRKVPA